ncbi:hypothetical protein [Actinomadura litoris]|uniref:Tetratricopeptide repeat protein n=1 Tax=Actinomadura litoris TaxID=2678616 RepID=A0A7K1KXK3_9ACTN|nr:hypothetical protein [Actinomadura litoris]MUN36924.1 hypothetical protein [Actinomadura litoris]
MDLSGIRHRLDRFRDEDDGALLGPAADADLVALLTEVASEFPAGMTATERLQPTGELLDAVYLLAEFYECRADVHSQRNSRKALALQEMLDSTTLYAIVQGRSPGDVPPRMRKAIDDLADEGLETAERLAVLWCGQGRLYRRPVLVNIGISWLREIARTVESRGSRWPRVMQLLGGAVYGRFLQQGDLRDLDESIECSLLAAARLPKNSEETAIALGNAALASRTRYERCRGHPDIHRAMTIGRDALAACPLDSAQRPNFLGQLGATLRLWYEHTGRLSDLAEAERTLRQAVASISDDHPNRATHLNNLGLVLLTRHEAKSEPDVIDEAIRLLRAAATAPHPLQASYRSNLAVALRQRYASAEAPDEGDLTEAKAVLEEAAAGSNQKDPAWSIIMRNLAE